MTGESAKQIQEPVERQGVVRPRIGIGYRSGLLTVAAPASERKSGYTVWLCRCGCGGEVCAPLHQLSAGYRRSCGCLCGPGGPRKNCTTGF